jgi:hypothetical protein
MHRIAPLVCCSGHHSNGTKVHRVLKSTYDTKTKQKHPFYFDILDKHNPHVDKLDRR